MRGSKGSDLGDTASNTRGAARVMRQMKQALFVLSLRKGSEKRRRERTKAALIGVGPEGKSPD